MGLDLELARLLLDARQSGVCFRRCVSLGRQHYFLGNNETRRLLRQRGLDPARWPRLMAMEQPKYAEGFWEMLGAEVQESIDVSAFEGASILHDMNLPIPERCREEFDAVCDAGTLEHIFNFPTAIRNCMELVRPGGHLLIYTTANNYFGHGFYQFSPELFFRVCSSRNGFEVQRMVAVEYAPFRRRYEVVDPEAIRRRVTLINHYPVLLYIQARRVERRPVLADVPQQSDYLVMWTQQPEGASAVRPGVPDASAILTKLKRTLVERTPRLARFLEGFLYSPLNRSFSFRDQSSFRRLSD